MGIPAKDRIHNLFRDPGNRESLDLLYKFLSHPSKGLSLCKIMPEERVKVLSFFENDHLQQHIHHIDMANPPRGIMELQQNIIHIYDESWPEKNIFFIYNIEGCIRLIEITADEYFQQMNLIRDFFMKFEAEFVFFVTDTLVNTIIQNAFDFYDWMKVTFIFTPEIKADTLHQEIKPEENIEYSNPLEKINYLEKSIEKVKNENARAVQQLQLGELYLQIDDYQKALAVFNKALEVFEKTQDLGNIELVRANLDRVNRLKKGNKENDDHMASSEFVENEQFNWEELIYLIHRRKVIPVIGHGLYRVEVEKENIKGVLLYDYLAGKVAKECGYTIIPGENHRFAKACFAFLKQKNNDFIHLSLFLLKILKDVQLIPTGSLWKLARLKAFNFFITTAYDDFLVNAINTIRGISTKMHYYSRWEKKLDEWKEDVFDDIRESKVTLVYQLFGNMNKNLLPAYTENDIMETLLQFKEDMAIRQPGNNLARTLSENSLLFIGCGFDDWLYRLFIRIITNKPYEKGRPNHTYVVDDFSNYKKDPFQELTRFLRDFETKVFYTGNGCDFIDILFEKLAEAYPGDSISSLNSPYVYISFTGEDRAAAGRLAANLRDDGINVWLDEWDLKPGDKVDQTISKAIQNSAVFIPLISQNSRALERNGKLKYHIREWEWAYYYSRQLSGKNINIIPIKIDDTDWMYEGFRGFFYLNIPGGERAGEYEKLKKRLLEIRHWSV